MFLLPSFSPLLLSYPSCLEFHLLPVLHHRHHHLHLPVHEKQNHDNMDKLNYTEKADLIKTINSDATVNKIKSIRLKTTNASISVNGCSQKFEECGMGLSICSHKSHFDRSHKTKAYYNNLGNMQEMTSCSNIDI
jgi:hypothetical protein